MAVAIVDADNVVVDKASVLDVHTAVVIDTD
jgi:hypothetical protein